MDFFLRQKYLRLAGTTSIIYQNVNFYFRNKKHACHQHLFPLIQKNGELLCYAIPLTNATSAKNKLYLISTHHSAP